MSSTKLLAIIIVVIAAIAVAASFLLAQRPRSGAPTGTHAETPEETHETFPTETSEVTRTQTETHETAPPQTEAGIPTYQGARVINIASYYYASLGIPEGVKVTAYYVEGASVKDIISWYKGKLSDYELVEEAGPIKVTTPNGTVEAAYTIFKKGDEGVGVWAVSSDKEGTQFFVASGNIEAITTGTTGHVTEKETLPISDQAKGKEPIPRYPNSVMLDYSRQEGLPTRTSIDYGTKSGVNEVVEWFKGKLTSSGWELKSEESSSGGATLTFSKKGESVEIDVEGPSEDRGYTLITISHESYGLPSKDLAKGKEPIPRYPNSVMLDYNSVVSGGAMIVTIEYGTYDSPSDVASWYESSLKAAGWQVIKGSSNGKITILMFKGSSKAEIDIEQEAGGAYTKITVGGAFPTG